MKQRKQLIAKHTIEGQNTRAKECIDSVLKKAEKINSDEDKKERLDQCLCKACFYILNMRMGGATMTSRPCGVCDLEMNFSSTATDAICPSCANENNLCKRCGANMDLKNIRSKYPFEIKN
jgi:hypothetical protein